jgi:hypothetical protein
MGDFDLTKINNERINIIVSRVRPGKSQLISDILRFMNEDRLFRLKSTNKEDECMVCYEENKKMYYTSCNKHYICYECSVKLFDKKCPMCRQ